MKKMTTRIAFLAIALFAQFISSGKGVDETTAKTIGANYLISVGVDGVRSPADLVTNYVTSTAIGSKTINNFYVFNIVGGDGFVMVSGDDLVIPILAYSNSSSFDIHSISPAAADWIDGYKNQITCVVKYQLAAQKGTAESWAELLKGAKTNVAAKTTAVAALCTTTWDQDPFYNAMCPAGTVTGCVATAMAQIMKFWNWPAVGSGMHSYTHPTYGLQTANFGTTAYKWTSMPNSISGTNSSIATLMKHCGVSVDMNYGPGSTGGSSAPTINSSSDQVNCAEYAFKTYFHYKTTVKGVTRYGTSPGSSDSFTAAAWISLLQGELTAGRPMLYSGFGATDGHAWVCDGWQVAGNMFHFNWGWSGTGPNGFYTVNNIAPPALGTGGGGGNFNQRQSVIMGIQPDTYPTYTGNVKMQSNINFTTSSPVNFGSTFSFKAKILNGNTTSFAGDICAQVYDPANTLVGTVQTYTGQTIAAGDSSALLTFTNPVNLNLVANVYNVRLMYRTTGTSAWSPVASNGTFVNYGTIDVRNDSAIRLYDSIKVITGKPLHEAHAVNISAGITNYSPNSFFGTIRAVLINVTTGTSYTLQSYASEVLAAYDFSVYTFSVASLSVPLGTYALEIQHQYDNAGAFWVTGAKDKPNPILVQVAFPTGISTLNEVPDEIFVYPNPATDMINILFNNHAVTEVTVTDLSGRMIGRSAVANGAAAMQLPLNEYAAGVYLVQMNTAAGMITKKITVTK